MTEQAFSRPPETVEPGRAGEECVPQSALQRYKITPSNPSVATLQRTRLLDWLDAKTKRRLVLLVAEAGYGKTTLLGDFARRTRARVMWYRLDGSDADLPTFIAYLVAAGKEHAETFGERTLALLAAADGPAIRDVLAESLISEITSLGGRTVLILDDFHAVDESDEVLWFVARLLRLANDTLTLVVSSRRRPDLRVGRLRTLGEAAELTRDDLRFHVDETTRLFSEIYHRDLEAGSLAELTARTEGWAASIHLVDAATRARTPAETRAFIRNLSGAAREIHDFLAEEVVGQLKKAEQDFLMRVSLLPVVRDETASIVAGVTKPEARGLIAAGERAGLLARRGTDRGLYRFHPLVQQFMQQRLLDEIGQAQVVELHRKVGLASEARDWTEACWHYSAAGAPEDVRRVLGRAVSRIMATGLYKTAGRYVTADVGLQADSAVSALVLSRLALASHDLDAATSLARRAVDLADVDEAALGNLVSILVGSGELAEARSVAASLLSRAADPQIRQVADVTVRLIDASVEGDLAAAAHSASSLAEASGGLGANRYEAIGLLNAAEVWRAIGRPAEAFDAASRARELLLASESNSEAATAASIMAWALVLTDGLHRGRSEFRSGTSGADGPTLIEVLCEFSLVESLYGEEGEASRLIADAKSRKASRSTELSEKVALAELALALRRSDPDAAASALGRIRPRAVSAQPGREVLRVVLQAHLSVLGAAEHCLARAIDALTVSTDQGCEWLVPYCRILVAFQGDAVAFDRLLVEVGRGNSSTLSALAELTFRPDHQLSPEATEAIRAEVVRFPERWRPTLRRVAEDSAHRSQFAAASLLDLAGTPEDIPRLRRIAKGIRGAGAHRELGRGLARRLAKPVFVEDQGRVSILVGEEEVPSRLVRRKVLALVCFLLTKPRFSAPRDEVLDALWPDMDPVDALNSLNQTVYFLRRVLEPAYVEDLSPGYINHESELVWLDADLVRSRSADCAAAIRRLGHPPLPSEVEVLAGNYRDRFALDFAYEDWASSYRDTQHAAFLHAVEEAVRLDAAAGHFRRGVDLARHALSIDPEANEVEEALLSLYRLEGAHAAAAEQYEHYSGALKRALDVDPRPLEDF